MFKPRNLVFVISLVFFFLFVMVFLSSLQISNTQEASLASVPPEGYVLATVQDLQMSPNGGVIFLAGDGVEKVLQIHIGIDQAHTLARVMNNLTIERPMTHDLLWEILKKSGTEIAYISVDKLEADTFYATIVLNNGEVSRLDARPSDSIIIALQLGAPIYVNKDLLDMRGTSPEHPEVQREEARSA